MSAGQAGASRGLFERVIETTANTVGGSIGWMAERGVLFGAFAILWAAVGLGILFNPGLVSEAWTALGQRDLITQALAWLLLLPVMAGLWIWHTDWPELVRIALVIAAAGWTLLVLWPRRPAKAAGSKEA